MRLSVVLAAAFAAAASGASAMTAEDMAVDLKAAQSAATSWEAGWNPLWEEFANMEHVKTLLGWKPKANSRPLPVAHPRMPGGVSAPASFDSRTKWPQCKTIGSIQNQARCGSCWAFGCIESVSDRFCIQTNGTFDQELSFQDLVSCGPDDGCEGGEPGDAWMWVQQNGVPTAACDPYTVPTCAPSQQPCLNFVDTPPCKQGTCANGKNWQNDLHYTKSTYQVGSVEDMMTEIATNGPVEACFSVYADFVHYKSGVYQHQSGGYLGGHCIKILGYGTEGGLPYWLVANSWTTYWGDKGYFKILKGQDECGIEDQVVAGMPKV